MILLTYLAWIISTVVITKVILEIYLIIARRIFLFERNYRGRNIPIGMGIIFPLVFLFLIPLYYRLIVPFETSIEPLIIYLIVTLSLAIVGYYDDLKGDKWVKGFRGHLGTFLREGKIHTGLIKIFVALILGIYVGTTFRQNIWEVFLSIAVFGLWTNVLNLLDVRPGRAIKGFWFISFLLYILFITKTTIAIFFCFWAISIVLFNVDRNERGMLGDAGANVLGGILGIWMIMMGELGELLLFLLIGIWITLFAERNSISSWIEAHPFLQRIDQWGSKKT